MLSPEILNFSTLDEIKANISIIFDKFMEDTVVVVRGCHLTEEEHLELVAIFGDVAKTFPNSSAGRYDLYTENHSRLSEVVASKDEVLVFWHLEHVETVDPKEIIIGAIWNMYKFDTDPQNGNTYFVDAADFFSNLDPKIQETLRTTAYTWFLGESGPHTVPAVGIHWRTGEEVLRVPFNTNALDIKASSLEGFDYSEDETRERVQIWENCTKEIMTNEKIRRVHQWQEGDIVFVDLYKNAHAVAGGFSPQDREFSGVWLYSIDNNEAHLD